MDEFIAPERFPARFAAPRTGRSVERPALGGGLTAVYRMSFANPRAGFWTALLLAIGLAAASAVGQVPPGGPETSPGQFFTVTEPITHETYARIRAATQQLVQRSASGERAARPIVVFEFLPGETAPGSSDFGVSYDLAQLISRELAGAKLTVAYVPHSLKGFAVLPVVACTEIILGSSATLGPIGAEGHAVDPAHRAGVRSLAVRKTRDPDLLLGMLDRDADLRLVHTADKTVHYVLGEHMDAFLKTHQILDEQPAWDGGQRGVLTAQRAQDEGFCKRTAESRAEVASIYQISGHSAVEDPTLGQEIRPLIIKLDGPLDTVTVSSVTRSLEQARQDNVNLVIFQMNCPGGVESVGDSLADIVSGIKEMKTVAYIDDRALGVAALVPLACRDIVFKKSARMGDIRQSISGRSGQLRDLSDLEISSIAKKAALLARQKGHPEAVAVAMVDSQAEVVEARDSHTGASRLVLRSEVIADRDRYQVIQTVKDTGSVLTVTADEAPAYRLGQVVAGDEELKALYGLRNRKIRVDGPGWVDSLVTILTDPYVSWLLLFVGGFMLVIELKLPGIGLPAITSALAFLLFFWSQYVRGTADQLEIILFLVGLVCLALELFVFPGFGVFGMSGILLMLASIVMASHTFIWPTQDYEYRELGFTLLQVTGMLAAIAVGAAVLGRYFPSLPLLNRLILKPEPWVGADSQDTLVRQAAEGYESLAFLVGETGRTTTPLRPTGKARFGNLVLDVAAAGVFVEPDSLVEVIDVQGTRVIVKKMGS
jgi:membrane-bound serine protease (ClpP class)